MRLPGAGGLALVLAAACGGGVPEPDRAGEDAPPVRLRFEDVAEASGLAAFQQVNGDAQKLLILQSIGAGVGWVDYDEDGWIDAYLTNGSTLDADPERGPADALFRNRGDGTFEDVTEAAGLGDRSWTSGVRAADVDGDGHRDLYLTNFGPNVLYTGRGAAGFEDVTARAGVGDPRWSTGAAFLDGDRDGDLDLYVANYVELDLDHPPSETVQYRGVAVYLGPRGLPGARDTYYENAGDGTFVDATAEAGLADSEGYGFGVVACDLDEDGLVDLYVGNDSTPNYLWKGDGRGGFTDVAFRSGAALSKEGMEQAGMGVCVGDPNGDGRLDLYVTNFSEDYYTLYLSDGGGFFSDATVKLGLARASLPLLGWGCGFADFDLDGDEDLFAVNGHVYPQVERFDLGTRYRQRNLLFENLGGGEFRDVGAEAGGGFAGRAVSRGAALGDFDNDGDLDVLVGVLDGPPELLENRTPPGGAALTVVLDPGPGRPEPVGARVEARAGDRVWVRAVAEGSSFLSQNDPRLHFGTGEARAVDLRVVWPDGEVQRLAGVPTGGVATVVRGREQVEHAPY